MNNALILTAPTAMTAPPAGTPVLPVRGDLIPITSDTFTGAASDLKGRVSDAGLGGQALPWVPHGSSPILSVAGGMASANPTATGSAFYCYDVPGSAVREVEVGVRIRTMFSASVYVDLFRASSPLDHKMRLILNASGGGSVTYTTPAGQGTEAVPGGTFTYNAGDRIRFRYSTQTGKTRVWVNDASVVDTTYRPPRVLDGQLFGIATIPYTTGALDDFSLSEVIL